MSPQESIAHYRIVSKLGEGGMGAVYRATDTKLNRDVAIKVLPKAFRRDTSRMRRFEREARVLASCDFDAELRRLVKDLTETMLDAPGAGLAAPQIGVGLRVFTYHVDDNEPGHLINPSLDLSEDEDEDNEGCLSFPGLVYQVKRAWGVVAKGFNMYGDPVTIEGTELLARCIQHETEHGRMYGQFLLFTKIAIVFLVLLLAGMGYFLT